jgi:hypothetical protein
VSEELPRFSVALYGAAQLRSAMLEEGVAREAIEVALSKLRDGIEQGIGGRSYGWATAGNRVSDTAMRCAEIKLRTEHGMGHWRNE